MSMIPVPSVDSIVLPANPLPPVRYAARELARCLASIFGAAPVLAQEPAGFFIRLDTSATGLPGGAFAWEVSGSGIRLCAGTAQGIVYGAYGLLEAMGCRFLARDCELMAKPPVSLPEGRHEEAPAFAVRELFWREAMDGDFAVKLRLNSARSSITPEQGGKAMFYNFSHTFNQLVPVEKYFDTHPEYFSMVEGRRLRERTQLCLTNPEVLRLCVEGVKKWARENPDCDIFSVAMNDWYQPCCCPACAAVDAEEGSQAGTMIRFVNAVAEEVEKELPRAKIHTFAYLYCRKPPRLVRPRHNVIVRLCSIECCFAHPIEQCGCETGGIDVQYGASRPFRGDRKQESSFLRDLKGWSEICENLFIWDYTTNYANYLQPFPNLGVLRENLRMFRRYGVRGVLEQGNFSRGRSSALAQLKIYLLGKLLWDPDLPEEELTREFVAGYYGPAAAPMLEYAALWRSACGEEDHASIYDPPTAAYLTDERLQAAAALLDQALALAGEGVYRERVDREALSVRYARLARLPMDAPGRDAQIDAFAADVRRLGVTELFERKNLEESFAAMKQSRYAADRSKVTAISYPF